MAILEYLFHQFPQDIFPPYGPTGFYGKSYHAYTLVYLAILSAFLVYILYDLILAFKGGLRFSIKRHLAGLKKVHFAVFIFFLFTITIIQTAVHIKYFVSFIAPFSVKNYHQKKADMSTIHAFSKKCQDFLGQVRLTGKIIIGEEEDPVFKTTAHRYFSYNLYPVIEIRSPDHKAGGPECLIFFRKRNAQQHVPHNYKIVYQENDHSLLALRKDRLGAH